MTPLQQAATALLEQWGSPRMNGCLIDLRTALADEQTQEVEPILYQCRMRPTWMPEGAGWTQWMDCRKEIFLSSNKNPIAHEHEYEARALYLHPAPPPVGERDHIEDVRNMVGERAKVGNSNFESWYSELHQSGKGSKQIAREAYEAGLNEAQQVVLSHPTIKEIVINADYREMWANKVRINQELCAQLTAPQETYMTEINKELSYGWLRACDEVMTSLHIGVANLSDSYASAKAKLQALIDLHITIATDPSINGGYKLVQIETCEAQQVVPKVTIELPDGDERTVKTWFTEMRNGELWVAISVEPVQSSSSLWLIRKTPNTKDSYYVAEGIPPNTVLEVYGIIKGDLNAS